MSVAKARKRLMERYHHLYKMYKVKELFKCFYCNMPADTIDHCPPLSYVGNFGVEFLEKNKIPMYKVPCCRECNSLLGDKMLPTLGERAEYLSDRLFKRYEIDVQSDLWSDDELDEMGYNMRKFISDSNDVKRISVRRVEYAKATASILLHNSVKE